MMGTKALHLHIKEGKKLGHHDTSCRIEHNDILRITTYHCYRGSANRMRQPKHLVLEISISTTSGGKGHKVYMLG